MSAVSRTTESFTNARVSLFFYLITLLLSFFSRKIFLDILGPDFVGLTATLQNLLGFLNLAELGVGVAVGYLLYKPLYEADQASIKEIISVFGYIYRQIGLLIMIAGVILSLFLPLIFHNVDFNSAVIFLAYYTFLCSSLIGYFINYKQTLLSADQKNYIVTSYYQTVYIVKTIFQMALAYYTGNYYIWIIIELLFGVIYAYLLNRKIYHVYPWLVSDCRNGRKILVKYPQVMKMTKLVFVHKLGALFQHQVTPFLIYAFVSLETVAFYGNYVLVTEKLKVLVNSLLGSTTAGIGNLIAEGEHDKIIKVYWELMAIRFFTTGLCVACLYYLLPPFIELWLGNQYLLDNKVFLCILIIFALNMSRETTDQFISGHGMYNDFWSPIVESVIFIVVSIIGGFYFGLTGMLFGSIASLALVIHIWKPYFLFTKGFRKKVSIYWAEFIKNIIYFTISFILFHIIHNMFELKVFHQTWISFIAYSIIVFSIFAIILFLCMYVGTIGMRSFVERIICLYKN